MALSRPFKEDCRALPLSASSLFQVIDGVTSLALSPEVISQAPQHFRSPYDLYSHADFEAFSLRVEFSN